MYYNEVTTLDPACADYINELSIYDAEIDDTFVVHISLPPDYNEASSYPMVVMTDAVWRLSDHPELRSSDDIRSDTGRYPCQHRVSKHLQL